MRSPCAMFLVATRCRPLVLDDRRANGAQLDLCSGQSALWCSLVSEKCGGNCHFGLDNNTLSSSAPPDKQSK